MPATLTSEAQAERGSWVGTFTLNWHLMSSTMLWYSQGLARCQYNTHRLCSLQRQELNVPKLRYLVTYTTETTLNRPHSISNETPTSSEEARLYKHVESTPGPYSDCSHWCDKKKLLRKRTNFGSQFNFIMMGRAWQNHGGRTLRLAFLTAWWIRKYGLRNAGTQLVFFFFPLYSVWDPTFRVGLPLSQTSLSANTIKDIQRSVSPRQFKFTMKIKHHRGSPCARSGELIFHYMTLSPTVMRTIDCNSHGFCPSH